MKDNSSCGHQENQSQDNFYSFSFHSLPVVSEMQATPVFCSGGTVIILHRLSRKKSHCLSVFAFSAAVTDISSYNSFYPFGRLYMLKGCDSNLMWLIGWWHRDPSIHWKGGQTTQYQNEDYCVNRCLLIPNRPSLIAAPTAMRIKHSGTDRHAWQQKKHTLSVQQS